SPRAAVGDPVTQLLFVADGTAGLSIIDLSVPGGSRDDDGDGIDDRVLATVDLGGFAAQAIAAWHDASGRFVVAVAAGKGGLFLIDPPIPGTDPLPCTVERARGMVVTTIADDPTWP